jgi:hypothetical protein
MVIWLNRQESATPKITIYYRRDPLSPEWINERYDVHPTV